MLRTSRRVHRGGQRDRPSEPGFGVRSNYRASCFSSAGLASRTLPVSVRVRPRAERRRLLAPRVWRLWAAPAPAPRAALTRPPPTFPLKRSRTATQEKEEGRPPVGRPAAPSPPRILDSPTLSQLLRAEQATLTLSYHPPSSSRQPTRVGLRSDSRLAIRIHSACQPTNP